MSNKAYVFSTLPVDMAYAVWSEGGADIKHVERSILIRGGAGVANDRLITPSGVGTEIDESDIALLKNNHVFQMHEKNGYVTVRSRNADAEKVAKDMKQKDGSSPLTPSDYKGKKDKSSIDLDVGDE